MVFLMYGAVNMEFNICWMTDIQYMDGLPTELPLLSQSFTEMYLLFTFILQQEWLSLTVSHHLAVINLTTITTINNNHSNNPNMLVNSDIYTDHGGIS